MRHLLRGCLLALLLSATSALAQFEGVLTLNLAVDSKNGAALGGGTINLAIAKAGMRGEIYLQEARGNVTKSVVLCKTNTPNLNYLISDAHQTYDVVDLSQPAEAASAEREQAQWKVKKLGKEKLLGYKTQHVLAKPSAGPVQSMELWLATDFLDFETYRKLDVCSGGGMGGSGGLTQALKAAGLEGMPFKVVVTTTDGCKVRMEVVKAEKKSLPASTFEIPAGYTKAAVRR